MGCSARPFDENGHGLDAAVPFESSAAWVYVHRRIPWHYFNHAVIPRCIPTTDSPLLTSLSRTMYHSGRPVCIETESSSTIPSREGSLLIDRSPSLAARSRLLAAALDDTGFMEWDRLLVMACDTVRLVHETATPQGYEVIPLPRRGHETQIRLHRAGFGGSQGRAARTDRELLRTNLRAGVEYLWAVDRLTGAPVGSAALLAVDSVAELFALSVLPDHRRKGVGSLLVRAAAAAALQRDCSLVYLEAEVAGVARSLYLKLGFESLWEQSIWLSV